MYERVCVGARTGMTARENRRRALKEGGVCGLGRGRGIVYFVAQYSSLCLTAYYEYRYHYPFKSEFLKTKSYIQNMKSFLGRRYPTVSTKVPSTPRHPH